jgi:uncharacterized protein
MKTNEVIGTLRQHRDELNRQGVVHAAVFGSLARGEARPDSDIDILIELDPRARLGVYDYVGIRDYITALFDRPVDVVNAEALKPYLRHSVRNETIYAF